VLDPYLAILKTANPISDCIDACQHYYRGKTYTEDYPKHTGRLLDQVVKKPCRMVSLGEIWLPIRRWFFVSLVGEYGCNLYAKQSDSKLPQRIISRSM
jgi:hypothetical protein